MVKIREYCPIIDQFNRPRDIIRKYPGLMLISTSNCITTDLLETLGLEWITWGLIYITWYVTPKRITEYTNWLEFEEALKLACKRKSMEDLITEAILRKD